MCQELILGRKRAQSEAVPPAAVALVTGGCALRGLPTLAQIGVLADRVCVLLDRIGALLERATVLTDRVAACAERVNAPPDRIGALPE